MGGLWSSEREGRTGTEIIVSGVTPLSQGTDTIRFQSSSPEGARGSDGRGTGPVWVSTGSEGSDPKNIKLVYFLRLAKSKAHKTDPNRSGTDGQGASRRHNSPVVCRTRPGEESPGLGGRVGSRPMTPSPDPLLCPTSPVRDDVRDRVETGTGGRS